MSGGSLINSIAINTRIKKIKKSLLQNYTKEKTDMIKILYLLSTPKIVIKNNGCFEKHYTICNFISKNQQNLNENNLNFHLNGYDKYEYLSNNDKNACTCINMDFIVERLMISSEHMTV
ncbi:094L [Invertebrate iridescent virus 6]|uniref:Uncharacterized protein 094L n=1 Tax=Invertebrate iridescent virus 6 TaxID=176652 RepID=094L_IIV6|nr:094L [Invertebrate iridescent virus 6]O55717.1 RecName: Full=Uncharacterized protein 094L [Invertebrate iridescent virus 6]AAB94428.1 094L [Invertebrate iridescent virus 6]